jgi:hypothetical protein
MNIICVDQNMPSIKFRILLVTWTFLVVYSSAVFPDSNFGRETILWVHIIESLILLVEHRTCVKSFQALRFPAIPLTSFHDLPVFLISSSVVLRHVLFGLPLLLYPCGFQSNAVFSVFPVSLRNVCPIQFYFLLFIIISIGFCLVIIHSFSFVISVFDMIINSSFRYTAVHRSRYTCFVNDTDILPIFGLFSETHDSTSWAAGLLTEYVCCTVYT